MKWRTIEFQYKINSKHSMEGILGEILIKNRLNISGVQTTPKQQEISLTRTFLLTERSPVPILH